MIKRFFVLLTLLFTLTIVVACSGADDGAGTETESEPEVNDTDSAQADDNETDTTTNGEGYEEVDVNNEEDNSEIDQDINEQQPQQNEPQGQKDLPEPIILNEQIQHPKGIVFVLEKITFKEDHIQVDFNAENHTGYIQHLASKGEAKGESLGGITLEDDTGFVYRYIAKDNPRIKLEDREKVTGTVSFTGTIQDDAESITLIFNPDNQFEFAFENLKLVR